MCTVTWLEREGGYELFCSRDELRTRAPAHPPRLHETASVRYLAPIDLDGGGTWIAVNDRGLGLTLLNDYASEPGRGPFESRGRLVSQLAEASSLARALATLRALDLERYRPFRLLLLSADLRARVHHWDGRSETEEARAAPALLTSSSFDPAAADRTRRELLVRRAAGSFDVATLLAFHRSHEPERGPLSPCMHRDDASTVSFTRLEVDRERAVMSYLAGPPCRGSRDASEVFVLPLRRRHATADA